MTTPSNAVELAVELDMSLGESPVWSAKDHVLYWSISIAVMSMPGRRIPGKRRSGTISSIRSVAWH